MLRAEEPVAEADAAADVVAALERKTPVDPGIAARMLALGAHTVADALSFDDSV